MRKEHRLVLAALAAAALGLARPASAAPVRVTVAVHRSVPAAVFHVAKLEGFFEAAGLDVGFVTLPSAPAAVLAALAKGTADAAYVIYTPAFAEAMAASGIRIVAGMDSDVKGEPQAAYYIVRKDLADKVRSYADLKGRSVAGPRPGSYGHMLLVRDLEKAGLGEADVVLSQPEKTMLLPLMAAGKLDVARFLEPAASEAVRKGVGSVFAGSNLAEESASHSVVLFGPRLLKDRETGRRFMAAYLRAVSFYMGMKPAQRRGVLAKALGAAPADEAVASFHPCPDGAIDFAMMEKLGAFAKERGLVKKLLPPAEVSDPWFLEAARPKAAPTKK